MSINKFLKSETVQRQETFLERTAVIWKTSIGSAVSWEIAYFTGSNHPYLAPLTFILCLQATIGQSIRYAMYRSIGTIIGVLIIGSFAKFIPITSFALAIALFISTSFMKLFRFSDQIVNQVALSILFVLYFEHHSAGYAWDRAKDTLIGAIVGVLFVALVFPPNELKQAENAFRRLVQHFTDAVNSVALTLQSNPIDSKQNTNLAQHGLFKEFQQVSQLFSKVKQGLPFNLSPNHVKAIRLEQRFYALYNAFMHFVVLTQTFNEYMTPLQREQWSTKVQSLKVEIPVMNSGDSLTPPFLDTYDSKTKEFHSNVSEYELQKIFDLLRRNSV